MSALQVALVAVAAVVSWYLTDRVRHYALASALLDIPNERSAHDRPVPRGGGLAIVLVSLAGTLVAALLSWIAPRTAIALLGAVPVAWIGWMDDRHDVPASRRALVHVASAAWAVWFLDGLPAFRFGEMRVPLGVAGPPLAILGIVAATNFFNFMDGIDGLAAGEAVAAGGVAGALLILLGSPGLGFLTLVLSAASFGFLTWNREPARIFMGDIGSGYLGFMLAVLALASERTNALPLVLWALILGVFIFDPLVTVLRRLVMGERLHVAHRAHAYQRAVQSGVSHTGVSVVAMLTTVALGALAALAAWRAQLSLIACLAGVVLLSALYLAVERRRPMRTLRTTRAPSL
ncbi:MAG: glycosyltransferase family 4 protein [Gemmatimonadota bacterium]